MLPLFWEGFGTGSGLIIAIGAQNAFVLAQGVRREHHLSVALVCALCDAALTAAGVAGMGAALAAAPALKQAAALGGALFLGLYGSASTACVRRVRPGAGERPFARRRMTTAKFAAAACAPCWP